MSQIQPIVNKAVNRAVEEIDLADFFPLENDIATIDLATFLFKGLLLKESDFREAVSQMQWQQFAEKYVCVHCSTNAIVPMWAYMVLAAQLAPFAKEVAACKPQDAAQVFLERNIIAFNTTQFEGKRVIVKGCGDKPIDERAYLLIAQKLAKQVRAIMYGEACSSVPVFKKQID
ncbi:MAG: DUF2480 family protein [Chitinophagales bacterium]|nr:DUF2480 family protein [Chitinophagales bacterium]